MKKELHKLESYKAKLIKEASIDQISDSVILLSDESGCRPLLKFPSEAKDILALLDGTQSISEILETLIKNEGTIRFSTVFSLIQILGSNGYLEEKRCDIISPNKFRHIIASYFIHKTPNIIVFIMKALVSFPVLTVSLILSFFIFFYIPDLKGIELFTLSINPLPENFNYITTIIASYIFLSLFVSFIHVVSAFYISSFNIKTPIHITFDKGLLSIQTELSRIAKTGRKNSLKLYGFNMIFPFGLLGTLLILYNTVIPHKSVIQCAFLIMIYSFFTISPLFNSLFTELIYLLSPPQVDKSSPLSFFRKMFLKEIFSLSKTNEQKKLYIVYSICGIFWLYSFYIVMWNSIKPGLSFLLADLIQFNLIKTASVIILLILIFSPVLYMIITALSLIAGNVNTVAVKRLDIIKRKALLLSSKKVPPQNEIVSFLKQVPLYMMLSEEQLKELCLHMKIRKYKPGIKIISQGESGSTFYTIVTGKVSVLKELIDGTQKQIDILSTADSFGEISLLKKIDRTASIKTRKETTVLELSKEGFEKFLYSCAYTKEELTSFIRLSHTVMNMDLFAFLSPHEITILLRNLKAMTLSGGETVFKKGDAGDYFYIIQEGSVLIHDENTEIATLSPGKYFGEIALIKKIPRTASAKSSTPSLVYRLDGAVFSKIIASNLFGGISLEQETKDRLQKLSEEVEAICYSS